MKKLISIAVIVIAFGSGCTNTKVQSNETGWSLDRKSLFQRVEASDLTISKDGTVNLKGYKNDGGNEALLNALITLSQSMALMKAGAVPTP